MAGNYAKTDRRWIPKSSFWERSPKSKVSFAVVNFWAPRSRSRQTIWLVWLRKNNILIPTSNYIPWITFSEEDGRDLNKVFIPMLNSAEDSDWENCWHLEISDRCELSNTKHSFLLYILCFNAGLDTHKHPPTQVSWNGWIRLEKSFPTICGTPFHNF